jgi:hypothetical protein
MSTDTQLREGEELVPVKTNPTATHPSLKEGETLAPRQPVVSRSSGASESTIPANYGFTPINMLGQAGEGLFELGKGVYGMGKDILFPEGNTEGERLRFLGNKYIVDPAKAENRKAQNAASPWESVGHSVAAAIPVVGPWAASLGEQAGTGDIGGALAKGGTQTLAAEFAPRFAGSAVGKTVRMGRGVLNIARALEEAGRTEPTAPAPEVQSNPFSEERVAARKANAPAEASRFKGTMDARRAAAKANYDASIPTVPAMAIETPTPIRSNPFAQPAQRFPFAASEPPPSVRTAFKVEVPGTVQNPGVLANGGGVRVPEPKLLPAPGRFAVPAEAESLAPFGRPKPTSTNKLVESIANKVVGVEEPPKAPAGKPLWAGPKAEQPGFAGPKETPHEGFKGSPKANENPFERSYESEEARKAAHADAYRQWEKLGRVELRQALIDSGENMGDRIISDAKGLGPGALSRREAIQILTRKGIVPPN